MTTNIVAVSSASDLREHLDDMNEDGQNTIISGMDAGGAPFLAYLEGPYAENLSVLTHNPWDVEIDLVAGSSRTCDDCGVWGPVRASELNYPAVVLVHELDVP